jgi:hypothetical protein
MFKSLLSILFTDILFPVYIFVCASLFLWLVPELGITHIYCYRCIYHCSSNNFRSL